MATLLCEICGKEMSGRSHKQTCSYNCRRVKQRRARREEIDALKVSTGCVKCGYNAHPAALDFNHLDPSSKSFNVAHAINSLVSKSKLMEEIGKCEILCANCHRIHTYDNHPTRLHQAGT